MEGMIVGLPAIAVSQNNGHRGPQDFRAAEAAVAQIVAGVQKNGLPKGVLLNVNVPDGPPENVRGIQVARLGQRSYPDQLIVREDPRGRPYYWIGGAEPEDLNEDGTDVAAIAAGYVSLTPVHMDLTSHRWLEELRGWGLS
jgi:5'-nucleotidase